MELGHIILVSLDGKPLRNSGRMLLQVMSEERPAGFQTEEQGKGVKRIVDIGRDPWLFKDLGGTVQLKRKDAPSLKVLALDFNGYPVNTIGSADTIQLHPDTLYYLLTR